MNAHSLARALLGELTYRAEEERSIDRLAALAMGSIGPAAGSNLADKFGDPVRKASRESHLNSLGTSLIAFKHARASSFYLRAVRDLGKALGWHKVKNRGSVARTAIGEWVADGCNACLGAREMADTHGVMRPCLTCGQTGKRRYRDDEVVPELGIHRQGIPGKAMTEAHGMISLAISTAIRGARKRFER